MRKFKPGDKVVVVNQMPEHYGRDLLPVGSEYTIHKYAGTTGSHATRVYLEEVLCHYDQDDFDFVPTATIDDLKRVVSDLRRQGIEVKAEIVEKKVVTL